MEDNSPDVSDSPRKRMKLSQDDGTMKPNIDRSLTPQELKAPQVEPAHQCSAADESATMTAIPRAATESDVGITEFVSLQSPGFSGILKKRYTDFLVNEISVDGHVLHLTSLKAPHKPDHKAHEVEASQPVAQTSSAIPNAGGESENEAGSVLNGTDNSKVQPGKAAPGVGAESEPPSSDIPVNDRSILVSHFGEAITAAAITLYAKILSAPKGSKSYEFGKVTSGIIIDRSLRTKIHHDVRRIFNSRLESSTDNDGAMVLSVNAANRNTYHNPNKSGGKVQNQQHRKGKLGWEDLGGQYLHFSIYKENKDTMEVISFLAYQLKMPSKLFQFAGTKDRRAVTVQRASVHRVYADKVASLNRGLRYASVGDFEYHPKGLELGELQGNEFLITLRDCRFGFEDGLDNNAKVEMAQMLISKGMTDLHEKGFFNYFGLQRFGTFSTRTDTVGVKFLQGDFEGGIKAILHFSPETLAAAHHVDLSADQQGLYSSDDRARAEAIDIFQTTGDTGQALSRLPKKFSAESNIIRHLGRNKTDYIGAFQMIPRNLRLIYVHAYQSLVWNRAVGERWKLYGDKVVDGDLVLVRDYAGEFESQAEPEPVDADGEVIIQVSAEDSATKDDDIFTRARALTAEEAASGRYSIFDIVLPTPGFDILYPTNAMRDWYKSFMASQEGGGLDSSDMRRKQKDISLSGSYRKVLSRIMPGYSGEVKAYVEDDEKFVLTDLEVMKSQTATSKSQGEVTPPEVKPELEGEIKLAVILKMKLGTSGYATMALRELSKGKIHQHKADFGGGR